MMRKCRVHDSHGLVPLMSVVVCGMFMQCWTSSVFSSLPRMRNWGTEGEISLPQRRKGWVVNSVYFGLSIPYQRGHQPLPYSSKSNLKAQNAFWHQKCIRKQGQKLLLCTHREHINRAGPQRRTQPQSQSSHTALLWPVPPWADSNWFLFRLQPTSSVCGFCDINIKVQAVSPRATDDFNTQAKQRNFQYSQTFDGVMYFKEISLGLTVSINIGMKGHFSEWYVNIAYTRQIENEWNTPCSP